mgnify:CR=1 FL=1
MKIILATGGTGGHIYPALRLAEELEIRDKQCDLLFIGNSDRMEAQIIPQAGYAFKGITAAAFNNASATHKLARLRILAASYRECLGIIAEFEPDVVVGFGGYVTVPVLLAAHHRHIPTIIHEQNSYVGMANRFLGRFADKIVTCYDSANASFPKGKVVELGNPRASLRIDMEGPDPVAGLGLDVRHPTVLIVMGSLGSLSINQRLKDAIRMMAGKPYNVIYVTGQKGYEGFMADLTETADNIRVLPYIDQAAIAARCALAVTRGGATSACEFQTLGVPTIIIPSPYVPNDHQYHNAMAMVDHGAAVLMPEKQLQAAALVAQIDILMDDPQRRSAMSQAAKAMAHPQAAGEFADLVVALAGGCR